MTRHLIVLQNGFNGMTWQMKMVEKYLRDHLPGNFVVETCNTNDLFHSWSGIAAAGQRLHQFVRDCLFKHQPEYLSFIGHSMGGLIIRHCLGELERAEAFTAFKPGFYISVASPHLGAVPVSGLKQWLASQLCILSADQLLLKDEAQFMLAISQPDSCYFKALSCFAQRLTYGNLSGDSLVSYQSAVIAPNPGLVSLEKERLWTVTTLPSQEQETVSQRIYHNLALLDWQRKAIDLADYRDVHNTILNKSLFPGSNLVLEDIVQALTTF